MLTPLPLEQRVNVKFPVINVTRQKVANFLQIQSPPGGREARQPFKVSLAFGKALLCHTATALQSGRQLGPSPPQSHDSLNIYTDQARLMSSFSFVLLNRREEGRALAVRRGFIESAHMSLNLFKI